MKLGRFDLQIATDGEFRLDGGAMFGVVPRTLWAKSNPPDATNRIAMRARALLLRGNGRTILVDNGNGEKWSEKMRAIYAIDSSELSIDRSLAAAGVKAEDVTDVILTHLHFDHCGGSTIALASGDVVPAFANARYFVQRDNIAWARNATEKDRGSYLAENFEPLLAHGVLELIDGAGDWDANIESILIHGHTRAHQMIRVHGPEGSVLFVGDLFPTTTHLAVPYVMAYDNFPLTTIEEKKALLPRIADERWTVVFEHDPVTVAAKVDAGPKGFVLGERVDL